MKVVALITLLSLASLATATPRIIGGTEADRGEFPHQGSMEYRGTLACGCVLVHAKWALTAGHCVSGTSPVYIQLLFGAHDVRPVFDQGTRHGISSFTMHPGFINISPWPNDVAVMQLSDPADLNDEYTDVIAISSLGIDYPFSDCVISGWGATTTGGGSVVDLLQRADTDVITQDECRQYYSGEDQIRDSHICVMDTESQSTGACFGDSGGPLTCNEGLAGMTSWGTSDCVTDHPSVYSRSSQFCDWFPTVTNGDVSCV